MKRVLGFALMCMVCACVPAQSSVKKDKEAEKSKGWQDNFEQAKQEAKSCNQPIFAFFTGSDWCGWCVKLHKEVLSTKAFETFAKDHLILFEADFPQNKKVSDKVKEQNSKLASQYGVRGYPTVILLDATGKELGRTGYQAGGGEAYVVHLKELLAKAGVKIGETPAKSKKLMPYEKGKAEKAATKAIEK